MVEYIVVIYWYLHILLTIRRPGTRGNILSTRDDGWFLVSLSLTLLPMPFRFFSHWDTAFQGPCNFHFLSPNHININCIALSFWNPISVDPVGDNHLHPWEVLWGFNSSSLLDQYDLHGNCDIDDCDIDDLHDNYDISDFTFVIYLLFKEYWKINNPKIKSCSWFFPLILKNIVTNSRF